MPSKRKPTHPKRMSGDEIRQAFLDYFTEMGHRIVPSSSLVPGNDPTLLFTNAGMVQFKDVFLGHDKRPYTRATTAQRCMRVSGKHNDLENVGPSPRHHTFFEMLGNFSFGEYFKREAIHYAYDCLTKVFGLDTSRMYYTVHEKDDEALRIWLEEIGVAPEHVARMGDKTNFWQMADTGPCGPTSEIHYDFAPERGSVSPRDLPHQLDVNPDGRFLEIWNLVFMQFNQSEDGSRVPLPAPGVDTGMGLERLAMIVQGVDNSYDTDLFSPIMDRIQSLAGHSAQERARNPIAYRVIADHARAATFLIADGVVPGNVGRNYICRMVIRRSSRFGSKAGFEGPFLADVAGTIIDRYGSIYPEIARNRPSILRMLTDEEKRFQRTVDTGVAHLARMLDTLQKGGTSELPGEQAFDLYATYGLPLELTRDIVREQGARVDETGFQRAMESHRLASGAGQVFGEIDDEGADLFGEILASLQEAGRLGAEGVAYDPYTSLESEGPVLALVRDGQRVRSASAGEAVAVVLPETGFYVEAGGQVADTGIIVSVTEPRWEIAVEEARQPVAGVIAHFGRVISGTPCEGDLALAAVDRARRWDIMRNHTATHLLHASLRAVLGEHVRQAGSLVAPDRLRFDFTHPQAMTAAEIEQVERMVNQAVLDNLELDVVQKSREQAVQEGAMALFGETYGDTVRTVSIGDARRVSYELCGGTHVPGTGTVGPFLIVSEGSVAAGVRRIEALTGRAALALIQARLHMLDRVAERLGASPDALEERIDSQLEERARLEHEKSQLRERLAAAEYEGLSLQQVSGITVLTGLVTDADAEALRRLTDRFRSEHPSGVAVLASAPDGKPMLVASISQDLVARGLDAGELVKAIAGIVGGGGGGRPTLAQAGGKDAARLPEALSSVAGWVSAHLK